VIHRDLKPSNIMLEPSGGVKVMDYGIARAQHLEGLTMTGTFLGTPYYAAPETVDGVAHPRSDLYSLGVVLFEMLTGRVPFQGDNAFVVMRRHCDTPPPVPSSLRRTVSVALDRIVLRLLSKDPTDRPSAEDLLNALADHLAEAG
jgi:serine/threonine protein kinase